MSLRYTHALIARPKDYAPSANQVATFLERMVSMEVVSGAPEVLLRTPSDQVRTGTNPFTGKTESFAMKKRTVLARSSDIAESIASEADFTVSVSSMGRPTRPPLSLDFIGEYFLGISCRIAPQLCSTCCLHDDTPDWPELPFFGDPWVDADGPSDGLYTSPKDGSTIRVADAACAKFWIDFELGNSVFPVMTDNSLDLLDPTIVSVARETFGTQFVQGCHWG